LTQNALILKWQKIKYAMLLMVQRMLTILHFHFLEFIFLGLLKWLLIGTRKVTKKWIARYL